MNSRMKVLQQKLDRPATEPQALYLGSLTLRNENVA